MNETAPSKPVVPVYNTGVNQLLESGNVVIYNSSQHLGVRVYNAEGNRFPNMDSYMCRTLDNRASFNLFPPADVVSDVLYSPRFRWKSPDTTGSAGGCCGGPGLMDQLVFLF